MDLDLPTGDEPIEEVLQPKKRCAGILVHPTSLPSTYGIGDIGTPTLDFLEWLNKAGQTLWQFLPLNPPDHGGSPYSTPSAMAANPILIALEVSCPLFVNKPDEMRYSKIAPSRWSK